MSYSLLSSVFYQNKDKYDALYESRFNSESAVHLPVEISGYPAFYIELPVISKMIESFYNCDRLITKLCSQRLPNAAIHQYINKNLVDEIMLTNDIEGVVSTRKEITEIINNTAEKNVRFIGLVKKYLKLLNDEEVPLNNSEDIRKLYDEIVLNEIEEEDVPDGEIFRRESVSVYSVTDKEQHKGIYPESSLISFMDKSLGLLKNGDINELTKISLFHYLFGYAHPFYDGNGRTGRFISSYLLSKQVHILIAIRISYTIKNDKNKYYKAFKVCNDPKNKGDLTPFVLMFLEVMEKSAENIVEKLLAAAQQLEYYKNILDKNNFSALSKRGKDIVFFLIQAELFGEHFVSVEEISKFLNCSASSVRNEMKALMETEFVPVVLSHNGHKNLYSVDLDKL